MELQEFEFQTDLAPASWILPRLRVWGPGTGTPVAAVVPDGFEAYGRVLHPVGGPTDNPVSWRAVAGATGRIYHPLVQYYLISSPIGGSVGTWEFSHPWEGHLT